MLDSLFGFFKLLTKMPVIFFGIIHYFYHRKNPLQQGQILKKTLEQLGPIFVKLGQLLSMRSDMFNAETLEALRLLQDKVKPFSGIDAEKAISQAFKTFDRIPLASASIAQVHAATLLDNTPIVVKILRPHIEKSIESDLYILRFMAKLMRFLFPNTRQFKPLEMIEEFSKVLRDEINLEYEAANASQLNRLFTNSPLLKIPHIYWSLSTPRVLVMEKMEGISILDRAALQKAGFNRTQLAKRLIELFVTQVFRDGFFHADLHPGNIFIDPHNPFNPRYILVDFGIMGSLSPTDKTYLIENILAFLNHDYQRVANLHIKAKWVPKTIRVNEFEAALRRVCEPLLARSGEDLSLGHLLLSLFNVARSFEINIQPQFLLFQKTLVYVESLSRYLDPTIHLFETAKPFIEPWVKKEAGLITLLEKLKIPKIIRMIARSTETL